MMDNKVILLLITFCFVVFAFDSSKFEKCDQKPFCKRLRKTEYSHSAYSVKIIDFEEYYVKGTISDNTTLYNDDLTFELQAYPNGIFRLQIYEDSPNPLKHRYQVQEVLLNDPNSKVPFTRKSETVFQGTLPEDFQLGFDKDWFQFVLMQGKQSVFAFNPNGKLRVENQFREKFQADPNKTEEVSYGMHTFSVLFEKQCFQLSN